MANLKAHIEAEKLGSLVPSGVVMPFAGSTAPSGWLLCDGSEVSQTTYPNLFAAIGTEYGEQYNPVTGSNWAAPSGGNFRVPDYRGIFLRGTGTPNGLDPVSLGGHQADKTKKNGLAVSGGTAALTGNVGGGTASMSSQGSVDISHDHGSHGHDVYPPNAGGGAVWSQAYTKNAAYSFSSEPMARAQSIGISLGSTSKGVSGASISNTPANNGTLGVSNTPASIGDGDAETRPINKGVNYIIKY